LSTDLVPGDDRGSRELWFTGPRRVEVRRGARPAPGPGQVLARALVSGVSQGTELLLYRGEGPTPFDPSLDAPGTPTYPRRYGYQWVGEVVERGAAAGDCPIGARVFALAPHGDYCIIDAASVRSVDASVPPSRAVLAASLETAITCVWDSGVSIGDEVVVLGGGAVGLLAAWIASAAGGRVRVVEPVAPRRALAAALGLSAEPPPEDVPIAAADVVIEATGDPANLTRAIAYAGFEATVVVASFYGTRTAAIALGDDFHRRRLTLRATQVSTIPPARAPRWDRARRFDLVRTLLRDAVLDALVDGPLPFDSAADVYARLDRTPGQGGQTVFAY
jgi:2-desacetyl-2-hydroxyethyl bacteriochlorophyllide A dehydrogenase